MGYGDVIPGNSPEKLLAMLGMALGVTVFAYFMGAMGSMLETLNTSDAKVGRAGREVGREVQRQALASTAAGRGRQRRARFKVTWAAIRWQRLAAHNRVTTR